MNANLSRLQFLKVGSALVASACLEAYFGPIAKLTRTLNQHLELAEGNIAERYVTFQELSNAVLEDPSNPYKRQLLETWMKFAAAERYAQINNFPVTEKLITRFLSTSGRRLNIGNALSESLANSLVGQNELKVSPEEMRKRLFEKAANSVIRNGIFQHTNGLEIPKDKLEVLLETNDLKKISFQGILPALNPDTLYGLGHATVSFSGIVDSTRRNEDDSWDILFTPGVTYSLYDVYDFTQKPKEDIAYSLRIGGSEIVLLTFNEARMLSESRYAKPFEVFIPPTEVELPSKITIPSSVF